MSNQCAHCDVIFEGQLDLVRHEQVYHHHLKRVGPRCVTERPDRGWGSKPDKWEQCVLPDGHLGPHAFTRAADDAPTDEELAEVYQSLGVEPPMQ